MSQQSTLASISNRQTASFPEKRWALVVGVNHPPFSHKAPLHYAVTDARQIATVLQDSCGFTLVREPLLDDAARSADVLQAITRELIADRQDNDFLLFYFSGHGIAYRIGDTFEETDIYLGTADFSPQDVKYFPDAHLSLKRLRQLLFERHYAGKVLIILDCCYAGNISGYGSDLTLDELRTLLSRYFDLNVIPAATMHGLRLALAATAYDQSTTETPAMEHGPLTHWLLPALSGAANEAIDYAGRVTFYSLRTYLQDKMHDEPPSGSGADAGRECILAYHSKHPISYFPYGPDPLFRPREGEFESLEPLLCSHQSEPASHPTPPVRLGLIGMGGVGKSQLAIELVCRTHAHFTDGVFWLAAAEDQTEQTPAKSANPLIHPLAMLASRTNYLPSGDDGTRPNEELRARHLCRFLAQHPLALLILDNLEDPNLLTTALPELAGSEPQCAILYTSRQQHRPRGLHIHPVEPLDKEQDLLALLLADVVPDVLAREGVNLREKALHAARSICQRVGGLPLALTLLRSQLEQNEWLTLTDLDTQLSKDGVLAVAYDELSIHQSLEATFLLSWQQVNSELARRMFLLASYFPEATPIPLWLLSLASGTNEDYNLRSPLITARNILRSLSLINNVSREEIQIHPLLRAFGQTLVSAMPNSAAFRQEASERVIVAFKDILQLEQRARNVGFWDCLSQIRTARTYLTSLQPDAQQHLQHIERCLDQETYFLATSGFWPEKIPGLFYQQMYTHLLEEQQPLPPPPPTGTQWLHQLERVGIQDTGLIRVFSGHSGGVNSVAFSPDGSRVLTGSEDTTARIFEAASGRTLHVLTGHSKVIDSVAYSPDGTCVLTGSRDNTARLWDAQTGECLRILEEHTDWINAVAFSPDGEFIVTGSQDGTARLWERSTGQVWATFSPYDRSPLLQTLWSERSDVQQQDPSRYSITSVTYSPGSTYIAIGTSAGQIFLWDTTNDTYKTALDRAGEIPSVTSLAYSLDASKLLIALDKFMLLWDCVHTTISDGFFIPAWRLSSVAFSHDPAGTYFLSGSLDGTVYLCQSSNGHALHIFKKQPGTINSVAFSPDDATILIGSSNGTAQLWEKMQELSPLTAEVSSRHDDESVEAQIVEPFIATFSSDGLLLLVFDHDFTASLWDLQSRTQLSIPVPVSSENLDLLTPRRILNGIDIANLAFFSANKDVAMVAVEGSVLAWNRNSGKLLRTFHLIDDHGIVFDACFSPNGHHVLIGSSDNTARLLSTTTGKTLRTLKGHTDIVISVTFSPDGTQLLTGSCDKTARLWKQHKRTYLPTILSGHQGRVDKVAFSPDGTKAFTGSEDTLLRIWDTSTGQLLATLDGQQGPVRFIACSPDNHYLLIGDMFNQVRIWRLSGHYELIGASSTNTRLVAACWSDEHTILLVDNAPTYGFPRMYTLRLET